MKPDDFKNIPFELNPNFVPDTNGEIIGEAKDIDEAKEDKIKYVTMQHGFLVDNNGNVVARIVSEHQMTDLKTLLKEAKEGNIYWLYEGKDGKPKAVEVKNDN